MWQPIETAPKDGRFIILRGVGRAKTDYGIARWYRSQWVDEHDLAYGADDIDCYREWHEIPDQENVNG
jgi:hypothetical protein